MPVNLLAIEELKETPPDYVAAVAWLVNWADNEEYETGCAFFEFLDLVGLSNYFYGARLNVPDYCPGYLESDYLGKALQEWAARPNDVRHYVAIIMELAD